MKNYTYLFGLLLIMLTINNCENPLSENPKNQINPETFLTTEKGMETLVQNGYGNLQYADQEQLTKIYMAEWPSDIVWQQGGSLNRNAVKYINWVWLPTDFLQGEWPWTKMYKTIRDANSILDQIESIDASDEYKELATAEARFMRATAYDYLYGWYGNVPLIIEPLSPDNIEIGQGEESVLLKFIEDELEAVIPDLPFPGEERQYGRATKGSALGILTKFHLNRKNWVKAADAARRLIDLGYYELEPDITTLFSAERDQNKEFIWVDPSTVLGRSNIIPFAHLPDNYPFVTGRNFGANTQVYDSHIHSFELPDDRRNMFITEYTDINGDFQQLLGDENGEPIDKSTSAKFVQDPNAQGGGHGNDFPVVRYADILLSLAEALNEINGPNQESIDLINEVRSRANANPVELSDFTDKSALRDYIIVKERAWEFITEAKRREDLIRHGTWVSQARERGIDAADFRRLYPIPEEEISANPNIVQVDGY